MTDSELQGLAAQALNMAKQEYKAGTFKYLLACYFEKNGVGIERLPRIEALLREKLGEGWMNSEEKKSIGFRNLKLAVQHLQPDAFVIVTETNMFRPTPALAAMSGEERKAVLDGPHERHHQAAREGLLEIVDSLSASAQNSERLCMYIQPVTAQGDFEGPPIVHLLDQKHFSGRLKFYGEEDDE
jgi:hypothetical protein